MTGLLALDLKLGGTRDLALLPAFDQLRYLELSMIRGFSDLGPVAELASLETLFLQSLSDVTELPELSKMTAYMAMGSQPSARGRVAG